MEASSSFLMTLGAALLLISWILLLITSWQEEYAWGMVSLLLPPLGYGICPVQTRQGGRFPGLRASGLDTGLVGLVKR